MNRRPPHLHVVKSAPTVVAGTQQDREQATPEDHLRTLFHAEAEINRLLVTVRAEMCEARRRYRDKHRLLALPGFDTLRRTLA